MKKILSLLAFLGLMALPAGAQFKGGGTPSFEIGGGYAYRSFDAQSFPNPNFGASGGPEARVPMNGFFATVNYNLNDFFGVVTDFDWARTNIPVDNNFPGKDTFSSLMVGPQIYPIGHHKLTPFGHVEFGLVHFKEDESALPSRQGCGTATGPTSGPNAGFGPFPCVSTDGSFAVSAGGGIDYSLMKGFAVRLGEFDWEQSRMFLPGPVTGNKNQNNWKVKAGVIIRFGEK